MSLPDHYGLLGVDPDASQSEIAQAFRKAAKRWHPDAHPQDRERATRRMQEINGAYAVLRDPAQRGAYDGKLAREAEEREAEEREAFEREAEEFAEEREAARLEAAKREAEKILVRDLRWKWEMTAIQVRLEWGPDAADALRHSLVEVFGPHLEHALQGPGGPLCDLYDECDAEVLEAERRMWHPTVRPSSVIDGTDRVPNAVPFEEASEVAASTATWVPLRPPRRTGGRRVAIFAAGAIAIALAGRAAVGHTERGAGEEARETLAAARPLAGAPAVGVMSSADDRGVLVSDLRRLDSAMERARQRGGRWPSRPPPGLTSQPGVRLQVGRITGGWVGVATSRASGQACRVDVTTQPSGRVRRMLRCAASAPALAPAAAR